MTDTVAMTVEEIHQLAKQVLSANGCDEANANAIATTVSTAERDGSESHGLFRIPGYVGSMRSGKVNGSANPQHEAVTPAVIRMNGDNGYTPLAIERGIPLLAESAKTCGIAAMSIVNTYHFAALWPETEALAEHGLVGMAFTAYKPKVAPAGAKEALFGTNPVSVAWPRPTKHRGFLIWPLHPAHLAISRLPRVTGTMYRSAPDSTATATRQLIPHKLQTEACSCHSADTKARQSPPW